MLQGGFGGVPSTPKPEMSRTGGLPASYSGSGALLGEFHQGFSPWVPLRCPSGALVDDLHPGMNFILADGFRASFVPPVARCPLRNSFSLTAPRPSLTYSSSRLDTVSRATRENSDIDTTWSNGTLQPYYDKNPDFSHALKALSRIPPPPGLLFFGRTCDDLHSVQLNARACARSTEHCAQLLAQVQARFASHAWAQAQAAHGTQP